MSELTTEQVLAMIQEAAERGQPVDLRNRDLRGIDLRRETVQQYAGRYPRAIPVTLEGVGLREAHLDGAHLEGAWLQGAHLERAWLEGAHLEGAALWRAHLEGAELGEAHLEGAWLSGAHLEGAHLMEAHLEAAKLPGVKVGRRQLRLEMVAGWQRRLLSVLETMAK